jgi:hypothetical protein
MPQRGPSITKLSAAGPVDAAPIVAPRSKQLSTLFALFGRMTMKLQVLQCGSCEPLKLAVHGAALGLAVVMGAYNAAAWLSRRQQHLAINTVLYAALIAWEQRHVAHHLAEMRKPREANAGAAGAVVVPIRAAAAPPIAA